MIVRFAPDPDSPTSGFKVFSRIGPLALEDDGSSGMVGRPYTWSELDTLGGRMLFVGRGCSRSYETADYPGFKAGIYFLDDRSFYEEEMMFRCVNERQYLCNDNGKWSEGPRSVVERFFPEQVPSNHSSPAWFLPRQRRAACLPKDILIEIARHVRCDAGRIRVLHACHLASADLGAAAPPPQLPWLLHPLPGGPSFSCLYCGDGAESVIHSVRTPADARFARYFGSYDGRWVFLAGGPVHKLVNILNGKVYLLPGRVAYPRNGRDDMAILAATLSSSPDNEGCVAAAIVQMDYLNKPKGIVFWEMTSAVGVDPFAPSSIKMDPEDVLFHNSSFYFITSTSEILVWKPDVSQGLLPHDNWSSYRIQYGTDGLHYQQIRSRYLVSSRGELLMVMKCGQQKNCRAEYFRVFHVTGLDETKPPFAPCLCTELKSLDGRMLFLGRGHSRSYETSDFPGFLSGIYFLDDNGSNQIDKASYSCNDNGRWSSGSPPIITNCFQPVQGGSDYSSPVWLLP
ncbi:hypothetical protein PVAP13_3KG217900 [Panicum virgatum]|uniref:KIB1-4 beta-propeller domain-containing protein n=2 Tax=Panicum virgatum TaxID=38727 RepID=A0A8T0UTL3_PANVG|nr:hypothetical protein PVAP13_3KG217900 [Panicum virgatum]